MAISNHQREQPSTASYWKTALAFLLGISILFQVYESTISIMVVDCTSRGFLGYGTYDHSDDNNETTSTTVGEPSQQHGTVIWITPRPREPRTLGWEDDYMMSFKKKHHNSSAQLLWCQMFPSSQSPYDHPTICTVPGYIPARWSLPSNSQRIPRVIFLSWMTRRLNRDKYTSVMTLVNHNPDYEIIFFTDQDMDDYVCRQHPEWVPEYSRLKAGAAKTDVWRMLIMEQYGGVYLDIDMSALAHLPIGPTDDIVSGVGGWGHLPTPGGVLEHWALVYVAHHPLIQTTLELIRDNIKSFNTSQFMIGPDYVKACESSTIRQTGPAPYQRALQQWLQTADCQVVDQSFVPAIENPQQNCNFTKFHQIFGNLRALPNVDLNLTLAAKLLDQKLHESAMVDFVSYDGEQTRPLSTPVTDFCLPEAMALRESQIQAVWQKRIDYKERKDK
ncbi:hypothetical protein ACA910_018068 [Epithemia clementina (nom. ined.)]